MASRERVQCLSGRYELGPVIGQGGMGRVHRAHDARLGREVAIKVLHLGIADDRGHRARFEREALLAARINHPNVVTVYDVGDEDDDLYLVMELLPGRTLADEIAIGPVEPRRARRLATELLAGLGAAHDQGVLHRDIKPSNILFSASGAAKLGDFGIAKLRSSLDLTDTGMLVGTAQYMPPERLAALPATESGDIYSLGAVLYEALAGRRAFEGDNPVEVAHAITTTTPPRIEELQPRIEPRLATALRRAMSHDPADRFATAAAMAAAIDGDDLTITTPVLLSPPDTALLPAAAGAPTARLPYPLPLPTAVAPAEATPVMHDTRARPTNPRRRFAMATIALVVSAGALVLFLASHRAASPTVVPAPQPTTSASVARPSTSAAPPTTTRTTPPTNPARTRQGHGGGKDKSG